MMTKTQKIFQRKEEYPSFLLGANYWPGFAAIHMWSDWRPDELCKDIEQMKAIGMNTCRFFLFLPDFLAEPDRVDPVMIGRLQIFLEHCESSGLYTLPSFLVGHMSGEDWDVSWRQGRSLITDPELLAAQEYYVSTIVDATYQYECIIGWLLSNELPNYIGIHTPAEIRDWTARMVGWIHSADPQKRPVSIGDGAWSPEIIGKQEPFQLRKLNPVQDFVGIHFYSRETDPWKLSFTAAFRLCMAREWGKPVIIEEFGTSTTHCSEANQAHYFRQVFHSSLINGAQGALGWCAYDFDTADMRPYSHHLFEEEFGVIRADRSLKPVAKEYGEFQKLLQRLEAGDYRREENPAGLLIPSDYYYPYPYKEKTSFFDEHDFYLECFTLLKRANLAVRCIFEPAQLLDEGGGYSHTVALDPKEIPVLFAPRLKFLTKSFLRQLTEYVERGGILYFSYAFDSWVKGWQKLAGIRHDIRFGVPDFAEDDEITILFKADYGDIGKGEKFRVPNRHDDMELAYCPILDYQGDAIATVQDGNPAIIRNPIGKGVVYFSAHPLEVIATVNPTADWKQLLLGFYRTVAREAGRSSHFRIRGDGLEMGTWHSSFGDRSLIVILNHSWQASQGIFQWAKDYQVDSVSNSYSHIDENQIRIDFQRKSVSIIELKREV